MRLHVCLLRRYAMGLTTKTTIATFPRNRCLFCSVIRRHVLCLRELEQKEDTRLRDTTTWRTVYKGISFGKSLKNKKPLIYFLVESVIGEISETINSHRVPVLVTRESPLSLVLGWRDRFLGDDFRKYFSTLDLSTRYRGAVCRWKPDCPARRLPDRVKTSADRAEWVRRPMLSGSYINYVPNLPTASTRVVFAFYVSMSMWS